MIKDQKLIDDYLRNHWGLTPNKERRRRVVVEEVDSVRRVAGMIGICDSGLVDRLPRGELK